MSALEIKPAQPGDLPILLSLIRELATYERREDEVMATEENLGRYLFGEEKKAEALLGILEGEVAGYALFFHTFSTFLGRPGIHLEDLYIKPGFRGRGFGKTLLQYVVRVAKARDCGRFEWTVLDWNRPAIEFYERLGATILPDWRICRVSGKAIDELALGVGEGV